MAAILAQQGHSEPSQETCRLLVDGVVEYHFDPKVPIGLEVCQPAGLIGVFIP